MAVGLVTAGGTCGYGCGRSGICNGSATDRDAVDQSDIGIRFDADANACTSRSADRAVSLRPNIGSHSDSDRDTCRRLDAHACPDTITDCGADTNARPTANTYPSANADA